MDYNDLLEARIQFGDAVIIVTSAGGITECYQATVIHVPQDAGDLWQFQGPDGLVYALNPYHSSLIRIEKATRSQP